MKKAIIIGSGPAGISAALYTVRAGIPTAVISKGIGALRTAESIENFYGVGSVSGAELHARGIEQARALGVEFIEDEALGLNWNGCYEIEAKNGKYTADAVILATGSSRKAPKIKGIAEFEARGVSYCAVCDAFAARGTHSVVIGAGEYALHEADALSGVAEKITILTNSQTDDKLDDSVFEKKGYSVIHTPIAEICGENRVSSVKFADGGEIECSMVFVALGVAGSVDLARKVGAYIENGKLTADEDMSLGLPGLYAAGDCTGGILQIS
jgi:thioredoxin reductase (NADPH)